LPILDNRSDMCPEMSDCAALQIFRRNSRYTGCGSSRDKLKMLAQLFRVRPSNPLALPT
jgi:hypothetical protein